MIKIKFKKIIAGLMLCAFALSYPVYADYEPIYDLTKVTRLSSGITYESMQKLTSNGWMNINIVRADLTDEYTKTGPLYNNAGTSIKTSLTNMMQQQNAIAGINGDFFIMDTPTQSYGPIISNGEIISSPYPYYENYPTVSLSNNGNVDISIWNPSISIKTSAGKALSIPFINKGASIRYNTVLLNSYYGEKTPGNKAYKDIIEVVIQNNTVTEIRENMEPTSIPKGGYVITTASDKRSEIKDMFSVGDTLDITFLFDFDINNLQWAVGGVNYLVKNGVINSIHKGVLGTHPRTAVGFNKDNTEIIFVTIDGRNKNYVGTTQTDLAKIMIELGAYNVVNLDGGGSTTMGVDFFKNGNIEVVNFPSDGKQRPIASGLGVFSNAPQNNDIKSIEITPQYDKIFKNTEIEILAKGFNSYYSEVTLADKKIEYSVENIKGTIEGNVFTPEEAGTATITARLGSLQAQTKIVVLDEPVTLSFEKDPILLDLGEEYKLDNLIGIDKNGNSAYISPKNITWSYRNSIGKVENGIFKANTIGNTGVLTATCGSALKHVNVKVGYLAKTIQSFEEKKNLKFSTYPENSNGGIEITENESKEQYNSLKLDYDFTNMTDQSIAYVELGEDSQGIKIDGRPKALGIWVYGDDSKHWLRSGIVDGNGNKYKLDLADEVDWNGWKWVYAKLPTDIAYPVTVKSVYLAEINETLNDSGTIYLDSLRALYDQRDKKFELDEESVFTDINKVTELADYEYKATINNTDIKLNKADKAKAEKPVILPIYISNGSIGTSVKAWNNIKAITKHENKNIILSLNTNINNISDKREQQIIDNIIAEASSKNNLYIVWKGNEEELILKNGIRYIQYDDLFEFFVTKDGAFYKN